MSKYPNIRKLHCKGRKPFLILFWVCIACFLLSFGTVMIEGCPFGVTLVLMLMIIPALIFAMFWLITYIRTNMALKNFPEEQLVEIDREIPIGFS